jgi:hypothetical protein
VLQFATVAQGDAEAVVSLGTIRAEVCRPAPGFDADFGQPNLHRERPVGTQEIDIVRSKRQRGLAQGPRMLDAPALLRVLQTLQQALELLLRRERARSVPPVVARRGGRHSIVVRNVALLELSPRYPNSPLDKIWCLADRFSGFAP